MAKETPLVEDNILTVKDPETDKVIYSFDIGSADEWKYWQGFLENEKSFRYLFTTRQGFKLSFSARKEKRPNGLYWYAHKYVDNKLRRKYIGKNDNLTPEKLREIALKISQAEINTSIV